MLAHSHRRNTGAGPARDGCAAAAVAFPELDGIRLAILGLRTCLGETVLHMHASGPMCHMSHGPDELYFWPVIRIRGIGGHWHATAHPRPERDRRQDRAAPAGGTAAEPRHRLDRGARRRAIGRGPHHLPLRWP